MAYDWLSVSGEHSAVELTEAGSMLLRHAERILGQLAAAKADLESVRASRDELLTVGVFESVAVRVMPQVLSRLSKRRPELRVLTHEAPSDRELFEAVATGSLDCAFADLPLRAGPFEAVELLRDPCVLVVAADSPLALRPEPPTMREVAELPIAGYNWRFSEVIEQRFNAEGVELKPTCRLETNSALQALVKSGVAAAIMPRLSVTTDDSGIAMVNLDGIVPPSTIAFYWHRDRLHASAVGAFLAECVTVCKVLSVQEARRELEMPRVTRNGANA